MHMKFFKSTSTHVAEHISSLQEKLLATVSGGDRMDPTMVYVMLAAAILLGALIVRIVVCHVCAFGGGRSHKRTNVILIGLPFSGKTALFSQLTTGKLADSRTSIEVNAGFLAPQHDQDARIVPTTRGRIRIVDYPGHRRLQVNLFPHLAEAHTVVVTIDSVTIHDDRHDGAVAVAELLLSVMQSPEFYGVRRVIVACTKRDELTSYSAKAVRKLLEGAMAKSIEARAGELGRVDAVVDANGAVVKAKKQKRRGNGRAYVLDVDEESRTFSFDQLNIPVHFLEVSNCPAADVHKFSVQPVVDFLVHAG